MTYRGFLVELLMAECDDRARRRSERRIKAAGFPREKSLRAFDFDANPNIDAATIHTLASCEWIKKSQPLCLIGDSGTGKSHMLIALGTEAAMKGYRVRYTLATKLVNELVEAADEKQLNKTIARYGRVDLLCIDELGYMELDRHGAELLFRVLTEREEKKQRRHRVQRVFRRLGQDVHGPASLRGHRRPPHLQRHHHRDRHGLLPPRQHPSPSPSRRISQSQLTPACLTPMDRRLAGGGSAYVGGARGNQHQKHRVRRLQTDQGPRRGRYSARSSHHPPPPRGAPPPVGHDG